ncbi:hypothetical protein [Caenimonas koreensis]|uniref:hypothetical protein n=1 Tax=Caenimonas koreensis TaxID=367474 RepID=UPI0037848B6E
MSASVSKNRPTNPIQVPNPPPTTGTLAGRDVSVVQPQEPYAGNRKASVSQTHEFAEPGEPHDYSPYEPQASRNRSLSDGYYERKHEGKLDGNADEAPLNGSLSRFNLELDPYTDEPQPLPLQAAKAPITCLQAQERVSKQAALLVQALVNVELDDAGFDSAMYLLMRDASKEFKALLAHDVPFGKALDVFTASAGETLQQMNSDDLAKVLDSLDRLAQFASDSNRRLLQRTFAKAIIEMEPMKLRRAALDAERAQQPPADTTAGKAKQAWLKTWRKTKRTGEKFDRKIGGAHRLERQAAEARARRRAGLEATLQKTMEVARLGGPARDATIAINIKLLTMALDGADSEQQRLTPDEFLAFAEDFLIKRSTDELVSIAQALLETAPGRTAINEHLNKLGKSLHDVLEMRPGTKATTLQLRNTQLSGWSASRHGFLTGRIEDAVQSLARPDVRTRPNGSKFVTAIFVGLHTVIPPSEEDHAFNKNLQLELERCTDEQLRQIKLNLDFVYPKKLQHRVITVDRLVQRDLRNRAMRLQDADVEPAPAIGDAAAAQNNSSAHVQLQAIAKMLALTLGEAPLAGRDEDALFISDFFMQAVEQVQRLMSEGTTLKHAVHLFRDALHATFDDMDARTLKVLTKALARLDRLPAPEGSAIVHRRLVEVLQQLDAQSMYEQRIEEEGINPAAPEGIAAKVKGAGLRRVRAMTQTIRGAEKAIAQSRVEREAAQREDYRDAIFDAMEDAVASALPTTRASDTGLDVALVKLMREANFEGSQIDSDEGRRFLAHAEDLLLTLNTDALVSFAQALLRTAPSRLKPDVRLDRLSMSLAEVLEMRAGAEPIAQSLRLAGRVSGPVEPGVLDQWRADRFDALLHDMRGDPSDATERGVARGAIEDLAFLISAIDAQTSPGRPTTQGFLDASMGRLTYIQRGHIQGMLESANLDSRQESVVNQLLNAIKPRQPAVASAG